MPATVAAGASFRAGLSSELLGTYRRQYAGNAARLGRIADLNVSSDKRSEFHFYWEAAPHIERWAYGDNMTNEGFRGIQFEVQNHRWAKAISWQADDRADDTTGSLVAHARGLGQSAALLDERLIFQILDGAVDSTLLPSIPNAPDGVPIHDSTAGRFGGTTDNHDTAQTTTSDTGLRAAYWDGVRDFHLFQDGKGQPLLEAEDLAKNVLCVFAPANVEAAAQAFKRSEVPDSSAGVSDEIRGSGHLVELWPNSRITDNDFMMFLQSVAVKPLFIQNREPLREVSANDSNSDRARDLDEESIRFKVRKGAGVALPYGTWKAS